MHAPYRRETLQPLDERMKTSPGSFDPAYLRWCAKFASFEARCFEELYEFVRAHFEDLLDRYYWEGNQSMLEFPTWVFDRYLADLETRRLPRRAGAAGLR